jgi:hypothetical protein
MKRDIYGELFLVIVADEGYFLLPPGHADFTLITEQTEGGGDTLDWDS